MKTKIKLLSTILSAIMLICTAPLAMAENTVYIPESTNTVWENDFEFVEATEGSLPSGTVSASTEFADIDMRLQNATYEIKEEAGNKYLYFKPSGTNQANAGSRMESGYFKTTSKSDGLIDKYKIDKLKLEISLKLDSLMDTSIRSYHLGTSTAYNLLDFTKDGKLVLAGVTDEPLEIGSYEAGEWMDIVLYVDYINHTIACYIDEERQGSTSISDLIEYFNQIRVRTQGASDTSALGVSIDNIRYSTTYMQDYIDRSPYGSVMAEINFDDMTAGTEIAGTSSDYQFVKPDVSKVTVSYDSEVGSNVGYIQDNATSTGGSFGIKADSLKNHYFYQKYEKYPTITKVEFEMKKKAAAAVYGSYGYEEKWGGESYKIFACLSSGKIRFYDNGANADTSLTRAVDKWFKVTMYFDFGTKKYQAYLDDAYVGEYTIASGITAGNAFLLGGNSSDNVLLNYMSISTINPYGSGEIASYVDRDALQKLGYVMHNSDEANQMTYDVLCAKYNADGVLQEVTITPCTVAAGATELKTLESKNPSNGEYYTYFIWDSKSTLKPLFPNKEIKW